MSEAGRPWRWEKSYPEGLSPYAELATWPVPAMLDRSAERWGDKPAFVFRGAELSYAALKRRSEELAAALIGNGIGPGARVALYMPNTLHHPVAFFAVLRAGATIVHLSPLDGAKVLAHKLTDSGARTIFTTNMGELAGGAGKLVAAGLVDRAIVCADEDFGPSPLTGPMPAGPGIVSLGDFLAAAGDGGSLPALSTEALALLQYTGGTTGMPKAAMLTHANLSAAVSSYEMWGRAEKLSRPGEERVLLVLPLFHIYALVSVMLRSLHDGQTLVMHTRFDAAAALAEIEAGVTAFPGVPTMWIAMCALPGFAGANLSSLRHCASGGAPLPVEVARRLNELAGLELLGGWGMTETSPAGTNIPKGHPEKAGTIGLPLPGIHFDIVALEEPARVLGPNEVGEMRVKGRNVTSGYLNRPDETRNTFSNGGLLTGDIGYMDEDGFLFLVDRKKDMIISGGYNIYPQLVEQAIYEHPDVEEVLVIGVADPYRGESAKAFVKLRAAAPALTLEALREFLKTRLGPHELPCALALRAALPRTPVGKLSKLELRQEEAARAATAQAS